MTLLIILFIDLPIFSSTYILYFQPPNKKKTIFCFMFWTLKYNQLNSFSLFLIFWVKCRYVDHSFCQPCYKSNFTWAQVNLSSLIPLVFQLTRWKLTLLISLAFRGFSVFKLHGCLIGLARVANLMSLWLKWNVFFFPDKSNPSSS